MARSIRKDFRKPNDESADAAPARRAKKKRGGLRLLIRLMIVAAVLLCLYALAVNWQDIAPDRFVAWISDVVSGTTGGSFPVSLTGDTVTDMQEAGSNLVLLGDTDVVYYNSSGGESLRRTCAYAKPLMRVSDQYVLLLESGGKRFRLETRSDIRLDMAVANTIYTGAVSKKGDVAVVTDSSQSYISEVTVYSRRGTQRYQWFSSEWLVMDVAFSNDGNSLAVVGCSAKDGAMQSAILSFDLRGREEQPKQYLGNGVLYSRVQYMNSGTVVALGDTQMRFVNPTGSLDVTVSHEEEELIGFAFGSSDTAVVTRPYGSQEGGTVTVYSVSGDVRSTHSFEGAFRDIAAANKDFLVLTDTYVYTVGHSGTVKQAAAQADSLMTAAIDGKALVLGLAALDEITFE